MVHVGVIKMKVFPRNKTWDKFAAEMPYVDVWYNILDSPEEGEILDYVFEIMAWAKEVGVWGEDDLAIIEQAKRDWDEDE